MTVKRLKQPPDPVQLGKLIGDILTGQVEDRALTPQEEGKDIIAVNRGKARAKSLYTQTAYRNCPHGCGSALEKALSRLVVTILGILAPFNIRG